MYKVMDVNWLFLDMNAYFASVEQQLRPELRNLPVAVVPVMVDTTCCIAASYEAKRYGIKTGTKVADARRLCPDIQLVESRTEVYVQFHESILEAVDTVLPIDQVHSIDEMSCRLTGRHRKLDQAISLANRVKQTVAELVGHYLRCSVGLAPNRFLAKVASNMEKPNGLTVITPEDIPKKLYSLKLSDLPGIGPGMQTRLKRNGITTVKKLFSLSTAEMAGVWKSVVGRRWWHLLRGYDLAETPARRRTVSHSHVLSPEYKTDKGARAVLVKLIHKAAHRLRRLDYWTNRLSVRVSFQNRKKTWRPSVKVGLCQDTQTIMDVFSKLWLERPSEWTPDYVAIALSDLVPSSSATPPLFPEDRKRLRISQTIDTINERFGPYSIYFASMYDAGPAAPMRIAFHHIPDLVAENDAPQKNQLMQDGS